VGLPDPSAAKAADRCQKQIGKAGEKFVKAKQKKLNKCLGGLFKCIQTKGAAKEADCIAKAVGKCDKDLAKIFSDDESRLEKSILARCTSFTDLFAADGLGFASIASRCQSDFGVTPTTTGDIAECVRRQKECTVERLVRLQFPRAAELLDTAGIDASLVGKLTCLAGSQSAGGAFGNTDPKGVGKRIAACAKEVGKAGSKFVSSKLKSVEKCLGAISKCVQTKPRDQACLDRVATKCAKELGVGGKIAKAEAKLRSAIQRKCSPVTFADLTGSSGMNLADVAEVCPQVGIAGLANLDDYTECLFRNHECFVDEMVATQYPRTGELLDKVGLEDHVPAIFCP
jgi:hypothetical protein